MEWEHTNVFSIIPDYEYNVIEKLAAHMSLRDNNDNVVLSCTDELCYKETFYKLIVNEEEKIPISYENNVEISKYKDSYICPLNKECVCTRDVKRCPLVLCANYLWLKRYRPKELDIQREIYKKSEDKIKMANLEGLFKKITMPVSDLPFVPSRKIKDAFHKVWNGKILFRKSAKDGTEKILAYYYDKENDSYVDYDFSMESDSNEIVNNWIKDLLDNSVSKYSDVSEYYLPAFVIALLNSKKYEDYLFTIERNEKFNVLTGNGIGYTGCVTGNDPKDIEEKVNSICNTLLRDYEIEDVSRRWYEALDLAQMLSTPADMYPELYPLKKEHLERNKIYVINELDTFVNCYNNPESQTQKRQMDHFIRELGTVGSNRFIILTGQKKHVKNFVNLSEQIKLSFKEPYIEIADKTPAELFAIFENLLPRKIKESLTEENKESFIEYVVYNRGSYPFKNTALAIYLADYATAAGRFELPQDLASLRRRDFMNELNNLTGMKKVKKTVVDFYNYASFIKTVNEQGGNVSRGNMHMLFTGNPGTGKTTIARIISRILYDIGICSENKLVEVERKDLIGEYVGSTAPKTYEVVEKALGGVLFIDEAYSLSQGGKGDYGLEAIATLIKAMEDHKEDLIVIFAGYKKEMSKFIDMNSGIASRIGYTFDFEDFTSNEMVDMFKIKAKKMGFSVNDCDREIKEVVDKFKHVKNLGNGRFVDKLIMLTLQKKAGKNDPRVLEIFKEDIPNAEDVLKYMPVGNDIDIDGSLDLETVKKRIYHELGHCIMIIKFNLGRIKNIRIETSASGDYGEVIWEADQINNFSSAEKMKNKIKELMAGYAAEYVIYGNYSKYEENDAKKAYELAKSMIENGFSELGFVSDIENNMRIGEISKKIVNEAYEEDVKEFTNNIEIFKTFVEFLLQNKELSGEEFKKIVCENF